MSTSGALPMTGSGPPHCRRVTIQLYCQLPLKYKRHEFTSGCLAIVLSTEQCRTRLSRETETTMKVWTGLISKKANNRPAWEGRLLEAVPCDSVLAIEAPDSPDNLSAVTVQHAVDGTPVELHVPGTWVLQIATPTFRQLVTLLSDFIAITLLEAGWVHMGAGSMLLQRQCSPVGRSAWLESMALTIAPIGSFPVTMLRDLEEFLLMRYPFLLYEGSKAHASGIETPPVRCPCACRSLEEVVDIVQASEIALAKSSSIPQASSKLLQTTATTTSVQVETLEIPSSVKPMLTSARHQQCCTMRGAEESEIAPVTSSRVAAPCSALQKQKKARQQGAISCVGG